MPTSHMTSASRQVRTARAVAATTDAGRALGLDGAHSKILHDVFSVVVHLAGRPWSPGRAPKPPGALRTRAAGRLLDDVLGVRGHRRFARAELRRRSGTRRGPARGAARLPGRPSVSLSPHRDLAHVPGAPGGAPRVAHPRGPRTGTGRVGRPRAHALHPRGVRRGVPPKSVSSRFMGMRPRTTSSGQPRESVMPISRT